MSTFNREAKGDFIDLELRIANSQRAILQKMWMSETEHRKMLETALENAITRIDVPALVAREAEAAITDAIKSYFTYGEGANCIRNATHRALNEALPQIFDKKRRK